MTPDGCLPLPYMYIPLFFYETAWPIKPKFYVEPPWEGKTKVFINGQCHMTKMATMPIFDKNLKNLLQNQKSYDLGTWHVSLRTQSLQSCLNDDPWLTLTYFTTRSNWVICTFKWGNCYKVILSRKTCSKGPY